MGNKVGFEVEQGSVKIAVLCEKPEDVQFMDNLNSSNLKRRVPMKETACVTYFFKYSIDQFVQLKHNENIFKLRKHFTQELNKPSVDIYMNRETSLFIENSPELRATIKELLQADFQPKYRQNYASSVQSLDCLNYFAQDRQYYRFTNTVTASQLHLITKGHECKKAYYPLPDYPYLLGSLRKGALFYKVNSKDNAEKVAGSIIGQLTICSILEKIAKCKEDNLEEVVNRAFEEGNNRNVDLLVEDIYGSSFHGLGIDGSVIASSLGKVSQQSQPNLELSRKSSDPLAQSTKSSVMDDRCKSLLLSFAINVAQFMCLQMRILKLDHCVLLANKFHNDYFYYTVQSLMAFFMPTSHIFFAELGNFMSCMGNIDFSGK